MNTSDPIADGGEKPSASGAQRPTAILSANRGLADPPTLWLVRHAEVEEQYQGLFGGRIDMGLSLRGHEQAAKLARYLHELSFDALYASPMARVKQTLAPWLANSAPNPTVLADLREVDFGDWTGLNWDQVLTRFGVHVTAWLEQIDVGGVPNGESGAVLRARLEPCLKQILSKHPGQQVVVACHGGVIRMLLSILFGWPLPRWSAVEIDYASVTRVGWSSGEPKLQLMNYTPWRTAKADI
jgi:broad specificity phosphatase PhoE